MTIVLILAGGFLVILYHATPGVQLNAWLAANIGVTAPLIIDRSLKAAPAGPPGTSS